MRTWEDGNKIGEVRGFVGRGQTESSSILNQSKSLDIEQLVGSTCENGSWTFSILGLIFSISLLHLIPAPQLRIFEPALQLSESNDTSIKLGTHFQTVLPSSLIILQRALTNTKHKRLPHPQLLQSIPNLSFPIFQPYCLVPPRSSFRDSRSARIDRL